MPRRSRARRNTQAARATDFDLRRTTRQLLTASPNSPQRHLSGGAPRDSSTNYPTLNKGVVQGPHSPAPIGGRKWGGWRLEGALAAPLSKVVAREPPAPRRNASITRSLRPFLACVGLEARTAGRQVVRSKSASEAKAGARSKQQRSRPPSLPNPQEVAPRAPTLVTS